MQTNVAKANAAENKQAEVAAVWHDGDAQNPDKMQAGRFNVPANGTVKPVNAAPGIEGDRSTLRPGELQATESHTEMAQPDPTASAPAAGQTSRARRAARRVSRQKESSKLQSERDSSRRRSSGETAVSRYVSFRDFDWVLLVLVLLICGLGVVEIYSATIGTKFIGVHLKQIYWILGGVALMFAVSLFNYQALLGARARCCTCYRSRRCWRSRSSAKNIWGRGAGCSSARSTSSRRSG